MRNICLVVLALASVASGCDGCDDDGGTHPGKDMAMPVDMAMGGNDIAMPVDMAMYTYSQFALDYAKAQCTRMIECGQQDNATYSVCIEKQARLKGWDVDSELVRGRVTLNGQPCLDALKVQRCDGADQQAVVAACDTKAILVPKQKKGETCLDDSECTTGRCLHSMVDGGTTLNPPGCPGICTDPAGLGEDCPNLTECGPGLICDFSNKCVAFVDDGAACDPFFGFPPCKQGVSYCPLTGTNPVCTKATATAADGAACDPWQGASTKVPPCPAADYCALSYDSGSNTWSGKCTAKAKSGAVCNLDNVTWKTNNNSSNPVDWVSFYNTDGQCEDGTTCIRDDVSAQTGHCKVLGIKDTACAPIDVTVNAISDCQAGYRCDGTTNKCVEFKADGATCTSGSECAASQINSTETCVPSSVGSSTKVCHSRKQFGASCVPGAEDPVCVAPVATDTANLTVLCAPSPNGGGTCSPRCY